MSTCPRTISEGTKNNDKRSDAGVASRVTEKNEPLHLYAHLPGKENKNIESRASCTKHDEK